MAAILLVEDNRDLALGLRVNFERAGYAVHWVADGNSALKSVSINPPDIVLLDLSLPDIDGFEVLRRIRLHNAALPVLVLTARREQAAKLHGLRGGADDYMTKPFDLAELLVRVEVVLRRVDRAQAAQPSATELFAFGAITVDSRSRTVRRDGHPVGVSRLGFDLLVALISRPGEVVARAELMRGVWGYADDVSSRTLDTHIFELRRHLEEDPSRPHFIQTVWRVGYRFVPQDIP